MTAVNVRVVGATVMVRGATTVRVTGKSIGLPVAPVEVTVTFPGYWPGWRVPLFAETWTSAGLFPLAGLTVSQLPLPLAVEVVTVKAKAPGVPATEIFCEAGARSEERRVGKECRSRW